MHAYLLRNYSSAIIAYAFFADTNNYQASYKCLNINIFDYDNIS